VLKLLKLNSLE